MTAIGVVFTVQSGDARWLFLSLPFTALIVVAGWLAPTGYRLTIDGVLIERRVGARRIPYETIRAVDREARQFRGLTVAACRGVFGRFGRFWSPELGFFRMYVTDATRLVWLTTSRGFVALSPDAPDEFVARLRTRLDGEG